MTVEDFSTPIAALRSALEFAAQQHPDLFLAKIRFGYRSSAESDHYWLMDFRASYMNGERIEEPATKRISEILAAWERCYQPFDSANIESDLS